MKILVTGANGLLGQKLCLLLESKLNVELIATARSPLTYKFTRGSFHTLDITNAMEVDRIISTTLPEIIINTAAMTQVDHCETEQDKCWSSNVTAIEYLVKACTNNNIKLIHVSTDFIFDGSQGLLKEDAKPGPVNFYGESKLAGEGILQKSNIDWAIARTVLVYGITADLSRSNIVLWVKESLEAGKTIRVVNDQWRTPTLAEDLAMGCYLIAAKKANGIYHISGDEMMTPFDIALKTAEYFHLDKSLIQATDSGKFKQPATRPLKTGFDITKAKQQLGYEPRSFADGLALLASQIQNIRLKK